VQCPSSTSWQTGPGVTFKQRWFAFGQSRDSVQVLWHFPKVHESGLLQSLFRIQVDPTGGVAWGSSDEQA
jgi:hypothetical protein